MAEVLSPLFLANAGEAPTVSRPLLVLRKRGQRFLFLPQETACAVRALNLYPAQKPLARCARALLRSALSLRLKFFFEKTFIKLSPEQPFARFLVSLTSSTALPQFAVLAGNPNAQGRRFILLVFNASNQPCVVVKVGYGKDAVRLIQKEEQFLSLAKLAGVPPLRASFQDDSIRAFALDFVDGNSPEETNDDEMGKLLHAWIDFNRLVGLSDVPAWKQLDEKCSDVPLFQSLRQRLESAQFHPVIHHGDFAPWNIKVSPQDGAWIALDWERGELVGFPNWDWFHYRIQSWILVEHLSVTHLAENIENLLCSDALQHYARATKTTNFIRELLLAYLLHAAEIIQPAEGLQTTRDLLNVLAKKWQLV